MKHLKYLNKFLWKYKATLLLGLVFIVLTNIFAIYPAEFVRNALDSLIEKLNSQENENISLVLLKYGGLIVLFAILKGIFLYMTRQTIIVMSRKIEFDLKNEVFDHYQKLSIGFYKINKTGDLMNRITEDITKVRMYLGPAIMYSINLSVLFSLVIYKMFAVSKILSIFVLFPLPLLAISVYFVSNRINKKSERVQAQLSTVTSISQESFSGIRIIKSFTNEENTLKVFFNSCKEYTSRQIELIKIEAMFIPLIITLIGISTVLTIYIGGLEVFKGNITTGNIAEFIIYVNMLAWPVASVGWVTSLIQRASASQERINEFLKNVPEIKNTNEVKTNLNSDIIFNRVSLVYSDTNIRALDNVNFKILNNKQIGIFGKTGSGKTSIVNLICRLYDVSSGNIQINDLNLKNIDLNHLRSSIGYVPQDGYLFSGTIRENIGFSSNNINNNEIEIAAKKAEMIDEINSFPDKFETVIGERGVQLSGGQRQRLAIARVFYKKPEIYIFDDCLSAVDANKEQKILENLKKETNSKTTIIISHRISTLEKSDNIIVMDEGKIIEEGTHSELLSNDSFYSQIHVNQTNNK
ncbi:MAG: ABC transporter ATP-binding protein [Flavobacteriales bacterium]|jgi:ATP-binding cassette subfamily B protein|tara:strand:+ start:6421 stop:8163 length:1743 start_codon:yes stop_codon:yes gene_type:complete